MVRLLIRTTEISRPGNMDYRIGDVVDIHPDGWIFGKREGPPNFTIVDLPGITEERVKQYKEEITIRVIENRREVWNRPTQRRKFKFDKDKLISTKRTQFEAGAVLVTDKEALESLFDKERGTTEYENGKREF
jgi:hypothetical protein